MGNQATGEYSCAPQPGASFSEGVILGAGIDGRYRVWARIGGGARGFGLCACHTDWPKQIPIAHGLTEFVFRLNKRFAGREEVRVLALLRLANDRLDEVAADRR